MAQVSLGKVREGNERPSRSGSDRVDAAGDVSQFEQTVDARGEGVGEVSRELESVVCWLCVSASVEPSTRGNTQYHREACGLWCA